MDNKTGIKKKSDGDSQDSRESVSTEEKILAAARVEFGGLGLGGGRMQSIADRARVNKALVHYYFRSKQNLYEQVFKNMVTHLWNAVRANMKDLDATDDLRGCVHVLVSTYINVLAAHPDFPGFFMRIITEDKKLLPRIFQEIFPSFGDIPTRLFTLLRREIKAGRVKPIQPVHFMINILGMCAATFIFKPLLQSLPEQIPFDRSFNEDFYKERIEAIAGMACDGLYLVKDIK